jgi:hypothetical protein
MMQMDGHTRKKSLGFLVFVLGLATIVSLLLVGKMRERRPFFGKVVAGYQCRFMLATDWEPAEDSLTVSTDMPEYHAFTKTEPPVRTWISNHIFHRPLSPAGALEPTLMMEIDSAHGRPDVIQIRQGYPEPNLQGMGQVLAERHLQIDGSRATVVLVELALGGPPIRGTFLCVYIPGASHTYLVGSVADLPNSDRSDREMQAIVASFHVDKVSSPLSGKRL